jgi:hypothetical protein
LPIPKGRKLTKGLDKVEIEMSKLHKDSVTKRKIPFKQKRKVEA